MGGRELKALKGIRRGRQAGNQSKQAGERQSSSQASRQGGRASKQARRPAGGKAGKQASIQADKRTSRQAVKQASRQAVNPRKPHMAKETMHPKIFLKRCLPFLLPLPPTSDPGF